MKALEFESVVTPGGQIALPPEIASEIPAGEHLRIVVMWEATNSELAWRRTGRQQFEAAYAPEDAVYGPLIHDASDR